MRVLSKMIKLINEGVSSTNLFYAKSSEKMEEEEIGLKIGIKCIFHLMVSDRDSKRLKDF